MLGPIGAEIMAIFRLLSPDEIDKYIVNKQERTVQEPSAMAANGESLGQRPQNQSLALEDKALEEPSDNEQEHAKDSAKVIPIRKEEAHQSQKRRQGEDQEQLKRQKSLKRPKVSVDNDKNSSLESIGVLSADAIRKIEQERIKEENNKKDSATVFLLSERKKMRESKQKLIEQGALRQYQVNLAYEFFEETEEDILDEERSTDLKGVLINKKHF
ncbi:MAG: hypothetical protein QF441_14495 [Bacteriovoracaceae bacterium]|jgi:hypothetical protein|nr:hypothetical protein [Halobacteriovoraceae bacterium]MDP7321814.1 hypothetical protein [Bacteriovoracaceae bacterium]|tara:strand:+ start:1800 stop:2444 length:645 start_codon:yes stop_codon:yes gene_type:complete